jgi:CubicO group peptidase (beta-lactamase class C family)
MDKDVQDRIDAIFEDVDRSDMPGCAIGIVQDGQLIYTRGYGMANLECQTPIDAQSIFHVASVSKQFTCLAILLLMRDGKRSLDDDVRTYIPELPDYGPVITIRHLVHHTSGLRDQWDLLRLAGWREDDVKTNADVLYLASRQKALNFFPGEEFLYCNTGYTLMALIVERLSGQPFRVFTQAQIFDPLGMMHTHFRDDHSELVVGRTSAYVPIDGGGYRVKIPMFDTVGATSLFTTVEDLARWVRNFELRTVGDGVLDQMYEQGVLKNGEQIGYAFGQTVSIDRGIRVVQHSGSDGGYRSHLVRFPEQRAAMIVLSNLSVSDPSGRVRQMRDVYFEDVLSPPNMPKAAEKLAEDVEVPEILPVDYVGDYYCYDLDAVYVISEDRGQLRVWHPRAGAGVLEPCGDDAFRGLAAHWAFARSANGQVCGFSLSTGRVRNVWFARRY